MKYTILATILMLSTHALADEESWYENGTFKAKPVAWLTEKSQECDWWHEFHSWDVK